MTLNKIEKGDLGVHIGSYATVLFALGLIDRLADLADATHDTVGRELEEEQLPNESVSHELKKSPGLLNPVTGNGPRGSCRRRLARRLASGGAPMARMRKAESFRARP
jgi:hypothetical protein